MSRWRCVTAGTLAMTLALLAVPAAAQIFWTDLGAVKIQRANLDGSGVKDVVVNLLHSPVGLAVDWTARKIYWTDEQTVKIQRSDLDGGNVEDLVTDLQIRPLGIAVDPAAGKMYWTVQGSFTTPGKIQRANLDGSDIEDLVTAGLIIPREIALDPAAGKMYWTHGFPAGSARIQRADLDGGNVETLVAAGLFAPSGIALDLASGKMYWADSGKIRRANLDGSKMEDVITGGLGPKRIALDLPAGKIYWTGTESILRGNLDGTGVEVLANFGHASSLLDSDPVGIAVDSASRRLYWADRITGKIQRAHLNGTEVEDLLERSLSIPRSIDLDPTAGKMYWADDGAYGTALIRRASFDGSRVADSVVLPLRILNGLALDVSGGRMYWTDSDGIDRADLDGANAESLFLFKGSKGLAIGPFDGKVYWVHGSVVRDVRFGGVARANPDGSGGQALFSSASDGLQDIALDPVAGHMYWTDAFEGTIRRANIDGSSRETVLKTDGFPAGIALDAARGHLYWADASAGKIQRADLGGAHVEDVVTGLLTPAGVAVLPTPLAASGLSFNDPAAGADAFIKVFDQLGLARPVGPVGSGCAAVKDVAVDPTSGRIYTIDLLPGPYGQRLFVVDPKTGEGRALPSTTSVAPPGFIWGLAFDAAGQLYGGGLGVYRIDKHTGRAELAATPGGVVIFGMAESPTGVGFMSTGQILVVAGLTIPYLGTHDASGAVADADVLVNESDERRVLFDIGRTPGGRLYGNALPVSLFAESLAAAGTPQAGEDIEALALAQARRPSTSRLSTRTARMAVELMADAKRLRSTAVQGQAGSSITGSRLILIEINPPMAIMTHGGALDAILLGLGGLVADPNE